MKKLSFSETRTYGTQSGQAMVFVVLVLGLFLLGSVAFAVDLSNLWFHRQTAQTASDAACLAGAMDLLVAANGGATGNQGFVAGTAFDCSPGGSPAAVPCWYAAHNGYDSQNTTPGNLVSVTFPGTVTGAGTPPTTITTVPFIQVDVVEHVQTFFMSLLGGGTTKDVHTFAICGTVLATSPIPILVLHPSLASSLQVGGNGNIKIVGGPTRSIQVNSSNSGAVGFNGNPTIDLSLGGPPASGSGSTVGTGSDLGAFGGPPPTPSQFVGGTTGHWISPAPPIADPFAQTPAPAQPTATGNSSGTPVLYGASGCPDLSGCLKFTPGTYTSPISLSNVTAIFDPGIYYITGSTNCGGGSQAALCLGSNSTVRPSTAVGDGSGGTMFYFAGTTSVGVAANSGSKSSCTVAGVNSPNNCIDAFQVSSVKCTPGSVVPPLKDPSTGTTVTQLGGNILLGACAAGTVGSALCAPNCGINYGDPLGTTGINGEQRGLLFFQNRAQNAGNNPNFGGGGTLLVAGTMYFHQCRTSGSDVGTGCVAGAYNDLVSLGGNSGGSTYVLGDIITDQLKLNGTSGISMTLNPTAAFNILKATLLR